MYTDAGGSTFTIGGPDTSKNDFRTGLAGVDVRKLWGATSPSVGTSVAAGALSFNFVAFEDETSIGRLSNAGTDSMVLGAFQSSTCASLTRSQLGCCVTTRVPTWTATTTT